ncbi:hypothetical protein AYO38_04640 [bacterium SCGC AG-212-C10]|nr:hypothetical protein AYO38_04640 [bacterium SCGC AG-212-C10]
MVLENIRPVPTIQVSPSEPLFDESLHIRVSGFRAGQRVSLRTRTRDYFGRLLTSRGDFVADDAGTVDLSKQAPTAGTYHGIDAMGLFWSEMLDDTATANPDLAWQLGTPLTTELFVEDEDGTVASTTLARRFRAPGVTSEEVRDHGLRGVLFLPPGAGPHPAAIVLTGSVGGLAWAEGGLLASHGFAALALAYFNYADLPPTLADIPLEYFGRAVGWLRKRADIRGPGLAVIGTSRGAELALLLGATFPDVTAVVAYVPSHVCWGPVGGAPGQAAWTQAGQAVATMPTPPISLAPAPGVTFRATPVFLSLLEDSIAEADAAIAVERISGPVLLISGEDDQLWPSALMAGRVMDRLAMKGHSFASSHLRYLNAGHLIGIPNMWTRVPALPHPINGVVYETGGSPDQNAYASADSWAKMLGFLPSWAENNK